MRGELAMSPTPSAGSRLDLDLGLELLTLTSDDRTVVGPPLVEYGLYTVQQEERLGQSTIFAQAGKPVGLARKLDETDDLSFYLRGRWRGDESKFSFLQNYKDNDVIVTADDTVHAVKKEVTISLDDEYYVLFVPSEVKFRRNVSAIKVDITHVRKRVKDLFVLTTNSYVENMRVNDNDVIWHKRLEHVEIDKLKVMTIRDPVHGLPNLSSFRDVMSVWDVSMGILYEGEVRGVREVCGVQGARGGKHGIRKELTCAHTPQQNEVAERKIRHLTKTCKCWLHAKDIPRAFWAEGMTCATYVINWMPLSTNNMKSPHELMFKEKPSIEHLRVFESTCYVHVPDAFRMKPDAKAQKLVFVGYDEMKKGWKCMDPETRKFVVSRDVVFDELTSFQDSSSVELQENKSDKGQGEAVRDLLVELPVSPGAAVSCGSGAKASESGSRGSDALVCPRGELVQKKKQKWWIRVKHCGGPKGLLFHQLDIGTGTW
ncbi:hypothetical protein KSP39_PZI024364 [Platanthera zijinensis]|uniref:Retroviral polymerase SH3-like domain-containing protein n=1 Tax=Platanthera zijinensis TaxID=2320716 RepID=A0AAP0ATV6_9ASPA